MYLVSEDMKFIDDCTAQWKSVNTTWWLFEYGGRAKFLISNYTRTWSVSAERLWHPFVSPPPHLYKKKESSCRQPLIKYFGFQLQLLYAHICCAINCFQCNWHIFHVLGENIYDMKKGKASRVQAPASYSLECKSCKLFNTV